MRKETKFREMRKETKFRDKNGNKLFVGDVVEIRSENSGRMFTMEVVEEYVDLHRVKQFIMGIESNCNDKTGEIAGWEITKI